MTIKLVVLTTCALLLLCADLLFYPTAAQDGSEPFDYEKFLKFHKFNRREKKKHEICIKLYNHKVNSLLLELCSIGCAMEAMELIDTNNMLTKENKYNQQLKNETREELSNKCSQSDSDHSYEYRTCWAAQCYENEQLFEKYKSLIPFIPEEDL